MVARIGLARPGGKARTVRLARPAGLMGLLIGMRRGRRFVGDHFAVMERKLCCASEERRASGAYFK